MSKTPRKPTLTVASSNTAKDVALTELVLQAASKPMPKAKPTPMPKATFSPEALSNLLNELNAQKAELAELKAKMVEANKAKIGHVTISQKPAVDRSAQNVELTIKAFKKIGITDVIPHQNTLTFRKWIERGYRPVEGSKAVKVSNLRLWHVSQCRLLTKAEIKAAKDQAKAADLRRNGSPELELQ